MVYFSLLCLFAVCATFIVENYDNWALSIVDFNCMLFYLLTDLFILKPVVLSWTRIRRKVEPEPIYVSWLDLKVDL